MPVFETTEPISITLDLQLGDARISAGDRADTVVDVRPSNPASELDVKAAEQTRVEYERGRLLVKTPKRRTVFGTPGSVDVTVELPAGSRVQGTAAMGRFRCEGRLGECQLKTATGDIHLDESGAPRLSTSFGDVTVDRATGSAYVTAGSGSVRIREIDGPAQISCSNGASWIGEVTGDLRVVSANGDISVDRAHAAVTAKSAHGSIRLGEVARGIVVLETAVGDLEVGIREGSAAWLDVSSTAGRIDNALDPSDGPQPSQESVDVRARTRFGNVVVRRS